MKKNKIGKELYSWAKILFPLNRSLTGGGVRDTLSFFKKKIPHTKKKILCFDGDGAITMHLGSLATSSKLNNIIHIVFNNKSHESVGGHDTTSKHINFYKLAKNLGYKKCSLAKNKKQALSLILKALKSNSSNFIEILCKKGHRSNISRPSEKMIELKKRFIKEI